MTSSTSPRVPDIFYLLSKWWKRILIIVLLSVVAVGTAVYLRPAKYLSIATALPAPTYANDKAGVFGESVQLLYPGIGIPDDLDKIVGTARLDTVYFYLTDQFNLWDHYKLPKDDNEVRQKCMIRLKENTQVLKSDYGELKVKVWDTDKNLAAQLANALMERLQQMHQRVQNASNGSVLLALKSARNKIQVLVDSIDHFYNNAGLTKNYPDGNILRRPALLDQLTKYDKLINEYDLMLSTNPAALIIVETARPAPWPDKPRRMQAILATAFISFMFSLLLVLVLERRTHLP